MTVKISALSEAVLPLTGEEEVLLVQAGVTRRSAAKNLASVILSGVATANIGAGQTDNLVVPDIENVHRIRVTSTNDAAVVTGIAGGTDGQLLLLTNVSAFAFTLPNENTSSTDVNRFSSNGDTYVPAKCSALFIYDDEINRWTKVVL